MRKKEETIRLYRGEGQKLDNSKLPDWMKSSQGMWWSSDVNVAKRFAAMREGSKIYYIDVPKSTADSWLNEGGIERGEYLVPRQSLKYFKRKMYQEKQSDNKENTRRNLEGKVVVFILLILGGIALSVFSLSATGNAISNLTQTTPGLLGILFFIVGLAGIFFNIK